VVACSDSDLRLTTKTADASYAVGAVVTFDLTVTNTSGTTCRRDLGPKLQEILVYSDSNRLWGSNDCKAGVGSDVSTLKAKQSRTLQVRWGALTSVPNCAISRVQVGKGAYQIKARIGTLQQTGSPLVVIGG
jgi:hypothetical protein